MRAGRVILGLCLALLLAGCQTALLESPAPAKVGSTSGTGSGATNSGAVGGTKTTSPASASSATGTQSGAAPRKTVSRHKPARDSGTATRNAAFVEKGVAKSDTYPKFVPARAATTQMSDAEKKAFEADMAARMKAGTKPSETQAEYEERLKLMRALAAGHGSDTLTGDQK